MFENRLASCYNPCNIVLLFNKQVTIEKFWTTERSRKREIFASGDQ